MIDAAAFAYVQTLVRDQAGIIVEPSKEYLAETRLSNVAREAGVSVSELVMQLRMTAFGDLHRRVVEAFTTNETSFYRDGRPFEVLRSTIIPKFARPLTIWCAAASSGQEPYSIAMLIREHFPLLRARIIASDYSREMTARIKTGVYSQFEVGRGLLPAQVQRHMLPLGTEWQMKAELRNMIEVREINLATKFPPLPPIDILFARNVLIYFDAATKQAILKRMNAVLAADGVLVLGGGESMLGVDVDFERCTNENRAAWYRRKELR